MARARALRKRDLRELGWKALVAELGVANATRFVMELHEGEQDYAKLRGSLFAGKSLDELYSEVQRVQRPHRGQRG
jgi:hypothetical protein